MKAIPAAAPIVIEIERNARVLRMGRNENRILVIVIELFGVQFQFEVDEICICICIYYSIY